MKYEIYSFNPILSWWQAITEVTTVFRNGLQNSSTSNLFVVIIFTLECSNKTFKNLQSPNFSLLQKA